MLAISADAERGFHKARIGELHTEHTKIKTRLDRLTDLFLDEDITKDVHEEKRKELIQKREKILQEIESHDHADNNFSKCLVSLVELASGAHEMFKGSTAEEKRKLINFVFANLELKGSKLHYSLRPPFDVFAKCGKIDEWRRGGDSNPWTGVTGLQFSRLAQSSTLPPLRGAFARTTILVA